MSQRWKTWTAVAAGVLAIYAALGFWVVPWAVQRALASYGHDRLQRQASVAEVRFNPFTLRMEARDFKLAEADGSPIAGIARLVVELGWRSLANGAWHFSQVEIGEPSLSVVIAPDGRVNLADLVQSATQGSEPSKEASLPRVLVDRFAIAGGTVDLQDRRAGYANTLSPIDFELSDFSTLEGREDTHSFMARSRRGGTLRWKGHASVNPLRASGEFELQAVSLPELSAYLKPAVRAAIAAGQLSATLPYTLAYADGKFDARLQGARLAVKDLSLVRQGASDAFAALSEFSASGIDVDAVRRAASVGQVTVQGGRLALRRDAKGELDLAQLAVQQPDAGAQAAGDWTLRLPKVEVAQLALAAVDETTNPSLKVQAGSVGVRLALDASQAAGRLDVKVADGGVSVTGLSIARGAQAPLKVASLGLEGGAVDLAARTASIERAWLQGAQLKVVRDKLGAIDLASWVPKGGASAPPSKDEMPWKASAKSLELSKIDLALADEASGVTLDVVGARARIDGAGSELRQPVKFNAGLSLREGGDLSAQGQVVPATGALDAQLKASRIALKPLQPLMSQYVKLKIANGAVSASGKLATGSGTRDRPALRFEGSFDVAGVEIRETGNEPFASWRSINAARVTASLGPNRIEVPELRIAGANAKLIIEEDRSFNAARLLVPRPAASAPAAPVRAEPTPVRAEPTPVRAEPTPVRAEPVEAFPVRIRRVRIEDAKLDFADLSLRPQFAAKIHELNGVVTGLSTSRTAAAQIELDGRVDEFGLARIRGETSLAVPTDSTDVNVVFRNVDMVPASPYSMKFAGYRIAEGKISLDLRYKIRNNKLEGDNRIVIDRLTLGERVDSPDALKIPLQLAIAILRDVDGRIDLGLPVSGDLSDPQFSYGAIVWKAITNVLTKIVTAPFRALGALLGVDGEKLEAIVFDPGSGRLLPPEREKLKQVAQVLAKRDTLKLSVAGPYSASADGAAMREQAVRRAIAQRAGIKLQPGEQAGPLDFGDRAIRTALRETYAQRFGDAELDKAKKAAESAAASAPAASATAANLPLWRRAANMVQGEPQVADAAAFYTSLRERLEREQPLPADALTQLGAERAKQVATALQESGVDASRLAVGAPEAAEAGAGKAVPMKLGLAAR